MSDAAGTSTGAIDEPDVFDGRLALQDMVLPLYRVTIYERLAPRIAKGLHVLTGTQADYGGVKVGDSIRGVEHTPTPNRFYGPGPLHVVWQEGVVKWLERVRPDVFLASGNTRILSTRVARNWAQKHDIPVLGWGLGTLVLTSTRFVGMRTRARTKFLNGFDGIIAYGSRAKKAYESLGIPGDRIFIAHNAISPRPTHDAPERPAELPTRPTLLFVGRLTEGKRIETLFDALGRIPAERRPRLEIVGDGPHMEPLRDAAKQLDDGDVEFLGAMHGTALEDRFRAADVFVLPGLGGLAIQEAMAYALPVIVGDADGTQDDLVRDANGWIITPGDAEELRGVIEDALSDATRLRTMGREGYRIVSEELNLENMVNELVHAVRSVRRKD